MGLFDFLRRREANSFPESLGNFYQVLTNGADADISALIYRKDLLSEGERQCCVTGVTYHCRTPETGGQLIEKSRQFSSTGDFVLLIVVPSWQPDEEDNFIPLIVTLERQEVRIVGIVLPFDGLMTKLRGSVCSQIGELSAAWVIRKIQARK